MRFPYGMVHGRYQPFHLGHLDNLRYVYERCEHVIVGITNPDPSLIAQEEESAHRHRADANPFTFFQRLTIVRRVAMDEGMDLDRVSIVPFPIHHSDRWPFYVPRDVVHFLTVYSDWERKKAERLRAAGYRVEVLSMPRRTSGTEIRRRLEEGKGWEALVPPGAAEVIRAIQRGEP